MDYDNVSAESPNPSRWMSILRSSELRDDNHVTFLVDGITAFEEMHRTILTAARDGHYVYLLGWWLSDDFDIVRPSPTAPTTIRALFEAASRRGVQLRTILWDQLPAKWDPSGIQNSAQVRHINSLANGAAILDGETFGRFGSHHQKVLVVKGSEGLAAFCGGIDINPDRISAVSSGGSGSGGGGGSPIHDVHCKITGPAAYDLLATFIQRWDHHPDSAEIDRKDGALLGRTEGVPAPNSVGRTSGAVGHCAVRITRTFNPTRQVANPMVRRERTIQETLTQAIQNARRFIYMEDQYLVNMRAAGLLNAALARIQHLTILVPHSSITDMPRVWEKRLEFLTRPTRGVDGNKVRIFFLSTPPNRPGISARLGTHTYVHSKIWVVDDELAVIGSANCNNRGWTHDSEVNAVIFESVNPSGPTFAQRLRMQLWSEHLNMNSSALSDGVAAAAHWLRPPSGARIRPYDPRADVDGPISRRIPWSVVDPAAP